MPNRAIRRQGRDQVVDVLTAAGAVESRTSAAASATTRRPRSPRAWPGRPGGHPDHPDPAPRRRRGDGRRPRRPGRHPGHPLSRLRSRSVDRGSRDVVRRVKEKQTRDDLPVPADGESVRIAIRALAANKLRALLTMLGIIIGVAAVISLMSVGRGAQAAVTDQSRASARTCSSSARAPRSRAASARARAAPRPSRWTTRQAIGEQVPDGRGVAPEIGGLAQLVASGQNWSTRVTGTTEDYPDVRNFHVADGDFFSRQQVDSRSRGGRARQRRGPEPVRRPRPGGRVGAHQPVRRPRRRTSASSA